AGSTENERRPSGRRSDMRAAKPLAYAEAAYPGGSDRAARAVAAAPRAAATIPRNLPEMTSNAANPRLHERNGMTSEDVGRASVEIAGVEISFETGKLAKQASGAVVVRAGDTMVLCTATAGNPRDVDFLPLTVDVEERMYAAGKIPGSFFKREGRAGEKATLTARLIDRPIRPLFP